MKVDIIKTFKFAHEGIHVRTYLKNTLHDVNDDLAKQWISEGFATKALNEKVVNKRVEKEIENKFISPAQTKLKDEIKKSSKSKPKKD